MNTDLKAVTEECAGDALTAEQGALTPCASPFCKTPMTAKTGKRSCSAHCRMDVYALRRARELKNRVGVVRFFELMGKV